MTGVEPSAADTILSLLAAIERRDRETIQKIYHPDVEFHWQPGLPYGGVHQGAAVSKMQECFAATWFPLQPTDYYRRMDPRLLATDPTGRVIINYTCRGLSKDGKAFETETLADYKVEGHRLKRAQMFYYDLLGLIDFLRRCGVA